MGRYVNGAERRWANEQSLTELARTQLFDARVFVLANREPYWHDLRADGAAVLRRSTSGLVTAVEPLILATSGTWIAHGAGAADHLTVERDHGLEVPPYKPRYRLRRVWLTNAEVQRYYEGFSNEGLWPLCHRAHVRPQFRTEDFEIYESVNRRFVECLAKEADTPTPTVLIQDYHFALAPRLVRERLPASVIVGFWHIPWPSWQVFETCPWKRELIEGLLGADILGFQTPGDCENFFETVERLSEARIWPQGQFVTYKGQRTEVRAYPASIEWPSRWAADAPPIEVCRREVRAALGLDLETALIVGVGRLDYTKGIEESLCALERLLERHPEYHGRLTYVQLADPSRTQVPAYRDLAERVAEAAGRVNSRFGQGSHRPAIVLRSHHQPAEVYRFLRAADACYVGSLHDGMNLVAKEFVAARDDERGALVLSVFTGAAWQLPDALVVNPYDLDEVAAALVRALEMSPEEQRERLWRMRAAVAEDNAHKWAAEILADVAHVHELRETGRRGSASRVGI